MTTSSFHPCCDAATSCKYFTPDVFICVIFLREAVHLKQYGRTKIAADEEPGPVYIKIEGFLNGNKIEEIQ